MIDVNHSNDALNKLLNNVKTSSINSRIKKSNYFYRLILLFKITKPDEIVNYELLTSRPKTEQEQE